MASDDDSLIVRGVRRAVGTTQRQVSRLRKPASWVRDKVSTSVVPRVEQQAEKFMLALADPENAQRVQTAFAHVAQLGMQMGFRADPDAAQLYQLVSWLEEEHGREVVGRCVIEHTARASSGFRKTIEMALYGATQPPGSPAQQEAAQQMHDVRDEVAEDLLELLCSLAAIEVGEEPPLDLDDQIEFFEHAGLPEEFADLAAKAVNRPGAFEAPEVAEGTKSGGSAIARFAPSFDDPHLRFLTLSQLFFINSYMTRNLIERLPELLAQAREFGG